MTLYLKIADDLRGKILDGEFSAGSRLPTEQELVDQHGVSRNTVRQAIEALANQGLITKQQGRGGGSFVRYRTVLTYYASRENSTASEHSAGFDNIIRAQGAEPHEKLNVSMVEATKDIASRLHISESSVVILRRLERSADQDPVSLQDSYYPEELVRGTRIMLPRSLVDGTANELASIGHAQVGYWDELTAEMPSLEEINALQLRPGVPVLKHWRTAYSVDRPLRVTFTRFAGDRNRLVYEGGNTSAMISCDIPDHDQ